jgi:hypothetical protein
MFDQLETIVLLRQRHAQFAAQPFAREHRRT